jgi:hypothetical protein
VRGADGGGVHGYGGGSVTHGWRRGVAQGWGAYDAGVGDGQQRAQDDNLRTVQSQVRTDRNVSW